MEESSNEMSILARMPTNELKIVFDKLREVTLGICERFPVPELRVIYEEALQDESCDYFPRQAILKRRFYFGDKEISREEYDGLVKIKHINHERRQVALGEAMVEILRGMKFISDYPEEKMVHLDHVIEILKDGPRGSDELQKIFSNSRKCHGHLVYPLLKDLEDAYIVNMRYDDGSKKVVYGLTPFWKKMYSIMKK